MTSTRTQRRSAVLREQIVDAAEVILAAQGSDGLTIQAVSSQADVAVQTVYNRVGGRPALLVAVAERALEQNRDYLESVVSDRSRTVWERIDALGFAYARFAESRAEQFQLITNPPSEPEALAPIEKLIGNQLKALAGLIAEGIADGTINPALEPESTATALWAMATGVFALRTRTDRLRADPEQIAALIATSRALLQDGMLGAAPPARPGD